jgi:hypothetical protein
MKTKPKFTEFNNMTRRSTNIFNSFKLNRSINAVTFPYLTKTLHLISKHFAVRGITNLTGTVENYSGNLYNSVRIQIKEIFY